MVAKTKHGKSLKHFCLTQKILSFQFLKNSLFSLIHKLFWHQSVRDIQLRWRPLYSIPSKFNIKLILARWKLLKWKEGTRLFTLRHTRDLLIIRYLCERAKISFFRAKKQRNVDAVPLFFFAPPPLSLSHSFTLSLSLSDSFCPEGESILFGEQENTINHRRR